MKAIKYLCIIIFILLNIFITGFVNAQESQDGKVPKIITLEFKVDGVCDMCKHRIERAALIKGVKYASWDKTSGMIKVIYKPRVVDEMEIHRAIATAGHDTEKMQAPDEAYHRLPDCCAYRDGVEVH